MAFAITEPDAGSNSHQHLHGGHPRRRRVPPQRHQVLHLRRRRGRPHILVVTRTGVDEETGRGRLSLFVVPTDAPGLQRTVIPVEIVAPEKQYTLFFDDVRVPAENLIGTEGDGLRQVFVGLNPERIMGAAGGIGIGRYALAKACRLRPRARGVGRADRDAPGHRPPAGRGLRSRSSWPG